MRGGARVCSVLPRSEGGECARAPGAHVALFVPVMEAAFVLMFNLDGMRHCWIRDMSFGILFGNKWLLILMRVRKKICTSIGVTTFSHK